MTVDSTTVDTTDIRRALDVLCEPGSVYELRALDVPDGRYATIISGYFDDLDKLALAAAEAEERVARGVYITLNPIKHALLARAANRSRMVQQRTPLTSDTDVERRRWLPLDFDAVRPAGISSTDKEHGAAREVARAVYKTLGEIGWPEPVAGDSGNGAHLLHRVDLPAKDDGLIERVLSALALRFNTEAVTVDESVYNPARIWKLYGSMTRKGDNTSDRPHRVSKLLHVPNPIGVVTREQLEAVAAWAPMQPKPERKPWSAEAFDIEGFIARHLPDLKGPHPWNGTDRKWVGSCPWDAAHTNDAFYIVEFRSGAIAAGCHHNGCKGRDWRALRDLLEPQRAAALHRNNGTPLAPAEPQPSVASAQLRVIRLSDVEPEEVRWLWRPYIPLGKVTLVAGDPGLGKSYLLTDIAARLSVGGEAPDRSVRLAQTPVVILSAEDALADTIRPRIDAQGGDPSQIHVIESVVEPDGDERLVNLSTDIERLSNVISEKAARMVVIDPINAYMGKVDSHKDAEVRQVLSPLKLLAERTGAAIVAVMHLNKGDSRQKPIYRVMASIGFTAAARSVLIVAESKDDPETRVLVPIKASVTKKGVGLTFTINEEPALVWGEQTDATAQELLASPDRDQQDPGSLDEAVDFLLVVLGDLKSYLGTQVQREAHQAGISPATLRRAREKLGVVKPEGVYRTSTGNQGGGEWWWKLPDSQDVPLRPTDGGASCDDETTALLPQDAHAPDAVEVSTLPEAVADGPPDVRRV